jgi:hypothetical protein
MFPMYIFGDLCRNLHGFHLRTTSTFYTPGDKGSFEYINIQMGLIHTYPSNLLGTFFWKKTGAIPSDQFQRTFKNRRNNDVFHHRFNSLQDAISGADAYAADHFSHDLISRNAGWRNGTATVEQVKFVNKYRVMRDKYDLPDERQTGKRLTKGAAADFITWVRNGGGKSLLKFVRWEELLEQSEEAREVISKEFNILVEAEAARLGISLESASKELCKKGMLDTIWCRHFPL